MRVVLDTNVLVSAMVTPDGAPRQVVDWLVEGRHKLVVDDRILREYRRVLCRPDLDIRPEEAQTILERIEEVALHVEVDQASVRLPDQSDSKFVECALQAQADCIVTGNRKHFPPAVCGGVRVLSPREFVDRSVPE
jgi:putative PIN family toxin of toxin-antitoxin system